MTVFVLLVVAMMTTTTLAARANRYADAQWANDAQDIDAELAALHEDAAASAAARVADDDKADAASNVDCASTLVSSGGGWFD